MPDFIPGRGVQMCYHNTCSFPLADENKITFSPLAIFQRESILEHSELIYFLHEPICEFAKTQVSEDKAPS